MTDPSVTGSSSPDLMPPTIGPTTDGGETAARGSDLVGTVLAGRYRILRKLGEGAMGAVYLGEHLKIGRQDAIKVLLDNLATDPEVIARFVRGTRNVSLIRHPNICTLYDYSDTGSGIQFVAMEFVPGETLKDLLQREGVLPIPRAIHIAKQVADALQAAHDAGIVHRDLKPANVMVVKGRRGEDQIKVVDFDIAKGPAEGEGEEVTRMGFVVGTPEYMSPEQLIGDRLDGRSDIYSLALVLFRMLTGMLPFRADSMQDLMIKRLTDQPLRLAEALPGGAFPEALEAVVCRALSRKPEDRQASAEEFGLQITEAISGPTEAAPRGPVTHSQTHAGQGTSDPSLPATRMGSASVASGATPATAPEGEPSAPRRGNRMVVLGAAGGLLVAAAAAAVFLLPLNRPETAPAPLEQQLPEQEVTAFRPDAAEALDNAGNGAGTGIAPSTEERDPQGASQTADPQTGTPTPPADNSQPVVSPPPTSSAMAWLTAASVDDVLIRLFDRIGPPYPSQRVLEAARDSALAVTRWGGGSTKQQAFAAHILGSTLIGLDERGEAVRWLSRAVELDPDNQGYRTLLDAYRR